MVREKAAVARATVAVLGEAEKEVLTEGGVEAAAATEEAGAWLEAEAEAATRAAAADAADRPAVLWEAPGAPGTKAAAAMVAVAARAGLRAVAVPKVAAAMEAG